MTELTHGTDAASALLLSGETSSEDETELLYACTIMLVRDKTLGTIGVQVTAETTIEDEVFPYSEDNLFISVTRLLEDLRVAGIMKSLARAMNNGD